MKKNFLVVFLVLCFIHSKGFDESSVDSLEKVAQQANQPDSSKLDALYKLARSYSFNAPDKALTYIELTYQLAKKMNRPKSMADAMSLKGKVLKNKGDFKQAIATHLEALKIKEHIKDTLGQSISYNDIGVVYKSMKNYTEAMKYYKKSNQLASAVNFGKGIANTLNNVGTSYFELRILDSATLYYNKALTKSLEINDPACLSTSYNNLGSIYGYQDNPKMALGYYLKCLDIDNATGDSYGKILSLLNIGESYKELKQYDNSLHYFSIAEKIALDEGAKPLLKETYRSIGDCYQKMKQFEKAYLYLNKYSGLNDTLLNEETNAQIAELQTRFDSEKKDLLIKNKDIELANNKADASKKKFLIYLLLVLSLSIVLIAFLAINRNKLKQKNLLQSERMRQKELQSKAILEAEETERKRIAAELHDGVGQILSAAKLNLSSLGSHLDNSNQQATLPYTTSIELVDDAVKEIRAISHNLMPNALVKSGLVAAVKEFVSKLNNSDKLKINLEITGLQQRLEPTSETILFRVLQELVSNIVKHANANQISIQLLQHENEITLMVEDNGIGFDTSSKDEMNGLGLKNIQSRIAFLNGQFNIDSATGKGTTVVIEIPFV
ncbi:MAG: sensor histidine kinase [Bacteroidia bacterium]|nr:sensor histidine kinase [Bacteroidia bacterium]